MPRKTEVEARLSQLSWRKACSAAEAMLRDEVDLGSKLLTFATYDESKASWEPYIRKVRERNDLILNWPESQMDDVRRWLDALGSRFHDRRGLWFFFMGEGIPPVADVPLDVILRQGIDVVAKQGRDLMLATPDLDDGLCLELNPVGAEAEFELVAWGAFAEGDLAG